MADDTNDADGIDPTLMKRAAQGSLEAQRELASVAGMLGSRASGMAALERYTVAEMAARMAASHGEPQDIVKLAEVLLIRANWFSSCREDALTLAGKALMLLNRQADAGCEAAAQALASIDPPLPKEAFGLAVEFERMGIQEV